MDRLFDSPWMLRITSLLLAILFYFFVVAEQQSASDSDNAMQTDIIMNVPLEVYYDSDNLFVTGVPSTVDVKISGPMAIVQQTKLVEDYKVFVDLNSLLIGEHSIPIQTENFSSKLEVEVEPRSIQVVIEEKVTQEYRVDPEINNSLVAEDYVLKDMTADPQRVFITGAKSIINSISYVKATVKADQGLSESFTQEASVIVLNRDLNKLDVSIEPAKVNVNVDIEQYSREVPVKLKQIGETAENIIVNSLTTDTTKVMLYGSKVILDSLGELVVEYDVADLKDSGEEKVKLVLPEGVSKASVEEITVNADVTVQQSDAEEVSVDVDTSTEELD